MVFNQEKGISLSSIFRLNKKFPGHVSDQIYENVRHQYLNTLKEQASFLITGLIIIEMALNIQGHLCYELMQNILYKNLPVVLFILFGIFLLVKLTQVIIDIFGAKHQVRIGNLPTEDMG
jgi:ABC-type dipeptide/oligopeptide/nickel transport system permease component